MPKIVFDLTGTRGLASKQVNSPYVSTRPQDSHFVLPGQYVDGFANPFSKQGYLSPVNKTKKDPSIVFDKVALASLNPPNGSLLYFGTLAIDATTAKIYCIDPSTKAIIATATLTGGNNPSVKQLVKYQLAKTSVTNIVPYIFYLWKRNISYDIGIVMSDLATDQDDNWLSSVPTGSLSLAGGSPTMVVADNTYLYVLDGISIHKIDGNSSGGIGGSVYKDVIKFTSASVLKDGIDSNGKLWCLLHPFGYSTNYQNQNDSISGVYIWDRQSVVISPSNFIRITGVRELLFIFEFENGIYVIDKSTQDLTELRRYQNGSFEVIEVLSRTAYPQFKDSIIITEQFFTWIGKDGTLYAYGKIMNGNYGIHKIGSFANDVGDGRTFLLGGAMSIGGYEVANTAGFSSEQIQLYISYLDSAQTVFQRIFSPNAFEVETVSQYASQGDVYTKVEYLPERVKLDKLLVYFPAVLGSSGTATVCTVKVYINQGTTPVHTITIDQNDAARGYKEHDLSKDNAVSVQLEFEWSESIALKNTITPSYATITYI